MRNSLRRISGAAGATGCAVSGTAGQVALIRRSANQTQRLTRFQSSPQAAAVGDPTKSVQRLPFFNLNVVA